MLSLKINSKVSAVKRSDTALYIHMNLLQLSFNRPHTYSQYWTGNTVAFNGGSHGWIFSKGNVFPHMHLHYKFISSSSKQRIQIRFIHIYTFFTCLEKKLKWGFHYGTAVCSRLEAFSNIKFNVWKCSVERTKSQTHWNFKERETCAEAMAVETSMYFVIPRFSFRKGKFLYVYHNKITLHPPLCTHALIGWEHKLFFFVSLGSFMALWW